MRQILFLTVFSILLAQGDSYTGFGTVQNNSGAYSLGIGANQLFSAANDEISANGISSHWKNKHFRFQMNSDFQFRSLEGNPNFKQNFSNFFVMFPVGKDKNFQISIAPYSRSSAWIQEEIRDEVVEFDGQALSFKRHFGSSGGISKLALAYSQKWDEMFAFGLGVDVFSGKLTYFDTTYTYTVQSGMDGERVYTISDSNNSITGNVFGGYRLNCEARFYGEKISIAGRYAHRLNMKNKRQAYFMGIGYGPEETFEIEDGLDHFRAGLHYKSNENSSFFAEIWQQNAISTLERIQLFEQSAPDKRGVSVGFRKQFHPSSIVTQKTLSLMTGAYAKEILWESGSSFDIGFTFGFGFQYNRSLSAIATSIQIGRVEAPFAPFKDEMYTKISLTFSNSERWFIRKK